MDKWTGERQICGQTSDTDTRIHRLNITQTTTSPAIFEICICSDLRTTTNIHCNSAKRSRPGGECKNFETGGEKDLQF